jgi:hypothetical protein
MPLREIWLDYKPERDAEVLRSLEGLEQINGMPAQGVLERAKEVEVNPLTVNPDRRQLISRPTTTGFPNPV